MKFCWSTLRVKNLDESLKFYSELLGLKINTRFKAGTDIEIAFISDGETQMELICDKNGGNIKYGEDISWGFQVDSLDAIMKILKEKGIDIVGPMQPNPNIKFIFIKDPNGFKIQLVENL